MGRARSPDLVHIVLLFTLSTGIICVLRYDLGFVFNGKYVRRRDNETDLDLCYSMIYN